ncbi:MAG TPA: T9SS type A sorting domain-containing protein [Cyclobacteriaceae bacterium]
MNKYQSDFRSFLGSASFQHCLFLLVILLPNSGLYSQSNCEAGTKDQFFNCYGGSQNFSEIYVDALTTFIDVEDAIGNGEYSMARTLLDELWGSYPIGNTIWNNGFADQFGTNIGSPYGYYGLRMMDDIVNFRLENPEENPNAVVASMKIILVGCIQGIQPSTQEELDNGIGVFETRSINPALADSDYRIIKQSIDLFTRYVEAITKGDLKVNIDFIELPDLCLDASVYSIAQGLYIAQPNLGAMWEAIDQDIFNETDWWMVISPSAVPIGDDFEDDVFITGGMGADNKGGPLFIADDSWLLRKPYHLGEGDYSEIERRAYLPQWYQHEFYHHLYRIYPEYSLEVNGHDWFNRNFWPSDFEGNYEPDYYAETLYKRLQVACEPLSSRLITRLTDSDLSLYSGLDLQDILGAYSLDNIGNDFHEGEIIESGNFIYWRNAAGVEWELTPRLTEGFLETGPDCPYPGNDHFIELATIEKEESIGVNIGFRFNGDFYRRRFRSFFGEIPVELIYGSYSSARGSATGEFYIQDQQYFWMDQDNNAYPIEVDFDQGILEGDFELGSLELIVYGDGNCISNRILGFKGEQDFYTAPKIIADNQSPVLVNAFEDIFLESDNIQSINLDDFFIDSDSDDILYYLFYDNEIISASIDGTSLNIRPITNGSTKVIIVALDANRGAVSAEFEVTASVPIVLSISSDLAEELLLYPNPSNDHINLVGLTSRVTYSIYKLTGKKKLEGSTSENIDISSLSSGVFILRIESLDKSFRFIHE